MRFLSHIFIVVSLLALFAGCAGPGPKPDTTSFDDLKLGGIRLMARDACPPVTSKDRKTCEEAISVLRREGILTKRGRIISVNWRQQLGSWSIEIQHPSGVRSHWLVSGFGEGFSGGTDTPFLLGS